MEKTNKKLVYTKKVCSEEFHSNFCHSGTYSSITCICGRTHFSDEFPLDEPSDEQEKLLLEKGNEKDPENYILHNGAVSWFSSCNKPVVFECPCNYAGHLEEIITDHTRSIVNYLKTVSLKAKQQADGFRDHVLSVDEV